MPAHQRLGSDDRHGLEDCRKPAIQLDEEQPIAIRELDATAPLAAFVLTMSQERVNDQLRETGVFWTFD